MFKSFKSHQFNDLWLFAEKVLLLWLFMPRGISNRWTWQLLHNNYCFICNNAIDIWNNFIFLCFLQHSQPQICTISIFFIWKHTPVNNYLVTTSKSQNVKITEIDTNLWRDIYLYFLRKEAFILLTKLFLKLAFWYIISKLYEKVFHFIWFFFTVVLLFWVAFIRLKNDQIICQTAKSNSKVCSKPKSRSKLVMLNHY